MINFGVIGTNKITDEFLKAASLVEDFKLNAVYSRTEKKAKSFAEKYAVTNIFTDLEKMAQSNCIDAVYIASPNSLHGVQSILFLENKKHVLCEKAIASNVKELKVMINTAKANNVLLMEAMKTNFVPNFKVIEENLYKLGKIRRFFANYCQYSSRYDSYKEGKVVNTFDPKFSNGALMDIGVYCLHPVVKLFGTPAEISANSLKLPGGVDGEGSLILTYKEMDAVIIYSKITYSHVPSEIQGEKGTMIIDKLNPPEKIQIIYNNGQCEDLSVPQLKDIMYYETKEFIDLIKDKKIESKINSYEQSLKVAEIMEKARLQTGIIFAADK